MTVNKSKSNSHAAVVRGTSVVEEVTVEDTVAIEAETAIAEIMATEAETIEDPEETSATGPKVASTVARMDTSPETALNVIYLVTFKPENPEISLPETETTETETSTERGAEAEVATDTKNTEREALQDQAEADRLAEKNDTCIGVCYF